MIRRKSTLFEQGISCIILIAVGISNAPFFPDPLRRRLYPFVILGLLLTLFVHLWYQVSHSKEDIKRAQKDERNQLILDKAIWCCWQVEDWLLLGLFALFGLGFEQYEIAYLLLWVLVGRNLLTFGVRWWLNRKY